MDPRESNLGPQACRQGFYAPSHLTGPQSAFSESKAPLRHLPETTEIASGNVQYCEASRIPGGENVATSWSLLFRFIFIFMCMNISPQLCLCAICVPGALWGPEKGTGAPRTESTDGCELPCGCW